MKIHHCLWLCGLAMAAGGCTAREETAAAPDATPPEVAILSPAPGADVADSVPVEIGAADDQGVARVTLTVDGTTIAHCYREPWIIPWATGTLPDSAHCTLIAEAVDAGGNLALSTPCEVRVITNGAPVIEILWPPDGLWIDLSQPQADWRCVATDPDGDALEIRWALDAVTLAETGVRIAAGDLNEGEHHIGVSAADRWGRRTESAHTVRAFRYSAGEAAEAVWGDFLAALGARDAPMAGSLLAQDCRLHTPSGELRSCDALIDGLTGILADSALQVLKVTSDPAVTEVFAVGDREYAKLEVRTLRISWACDSQEALHAGAARIFLARESGLWRILSWWDLHGATWAPGGALSWSALLAAGVASHGGSG